MTTWKLVLWIMGLALFSADLVMIAALPDTGAQLPIVLALPWLSIPLVLPYALERWS